MDKVLLNYEMNQYMSYYQKTLDMDHPTIEFILTKGDYRIVGVYEQHDHSINYIENEEENDLFIYDHIDIDDVGYGFEAYILYYLTKGYEIEFIHYDAHIKLWQYISGLVDEETILEEGISKYLSYSNCIGITYSLMNNYSEYEVEDLYEVFFFDGKES